MRFLWLAIFVSLLSFLFVGGFCFHLETKQKEKEEKEKKKGRRMTPRKTTSSEDIWYMVNPPKQAALLCKRIYRIYVFFWYTTSSTSSLQRRAEQQLIYQSTQGSCRPLIQFCAAFELEQSEHPSLRPGHLLGGGTNWKRKPTGDTLSTAFLKVDEINPGSGLRFDLGQTWCCVQIQVQQVHVCPLLWGVVFDHCPTFLNCQSRLFLPTFSFVSTIPSD